MSSTPDSVDVDEGIIVFSGCLSTMFVHSFVWTDPVTTVSHERLELFL